MTKYLPISSYIRKPFLIYNFAIDPIWISLYMRKIVFSLFISVPDDVGMTVALSEQGDLPGGEQAVGVVGDRHFLHCHWPVVKPTLSMLTKVSAVHVEDPWHVGTDPDPRIYWLRDRAIFVSELQDGDQCFFIGYFAYNFL